MPKYELFTTAEVRNFEALRSYAGVSDAVSVTDVTTGGLFLNDVTDLSSSDDNENTIVDYKGRRWKRSRPDLGNVDFLQSGTGAVTRTAQDKMREVEVSVTDFLPRNEDYETYDCTSGIQAAADYCASFTAYAEGRGGPTLVFPPTGGMGYRVTSAITIAANVPVEMRNCSLLYGEAANITVLTIGEASTRSYRNRLVGLDVRRTDNITWTNESDIGICLINQFFSEIEIRGARNFGIGARCQGVNPGEGFYYNRVSLGYFFGNGINLDLMGGNGVTGGWCNENLWIGGEFQGGTTNSYDRYGVRISNDPVGVTLNDCNLFIKPSFEMNGVSGDESIPFLIEHSDALRVINARWEGAIADTFARILNESTNTDIHVSHQRIYDSSIDDQSTARSTTVQNLKANFQHEGKAIYVSGPLGRMACRYNGTRYHIPGLNFYRQVDTTVIGNSGPIASISGSKIQLASDVGVARMVRTERCKKFSVNIDADTGEYPWIVVQCFDASGTILTSAGAGHPYVSGPGFVWSSGWNGYARPDAVIGERLLTVSDDVKYIRIGIYNGYLRGFSIYALGVDHQFAPTYSGYEDVVPGANIGTQAPVDGTWEQGRVVFNATPAASGFIGWVCVTGGTPGTWKTFGAISA